jgi:steroid delta-isomerase-like uncharacterized protein
MEHDNERIMRRWFEEVWNQGKTATIEELMDPQAVAHGLGSDGNPVVGPAGFRPFFDTLRGTFPDIHITVEDVVSQGEKVACRWSATMTHQGPQLGLPPTGRKVAVTGMTFARVKEGRIVEGWNNWDVMGMMQQLGGNNRQPDGQ